MKTLVVRQSADGSETVEEVTFPPVVYVPVAALPQDDQMTLDLRPMQDGRLALLVYSALDRLVASCGEHQPWIVMPSAKLELLQQNSGFEVIFLDLRVPEELRRPAPAVEGEDGG